MIDLPAYFDRIGFEGDVASMTDVARLQRAHMQAIAFENIDPLLGRTPDLSLAAIEAKLVGSRRGGYCFEHNRLLAEALRRHGWRVVPVLAQVRLGAGPAPRRTHLSLRVSRPDGGGGDRLVDAGFGGPGATGPLPFGLCGPDRIGDGEYRIAADPQTGEMVLSLARDGGWFELYSLDGAEAREVEIAEANRYCSTSPASILTARLMMSRITARGRVTMLDRVVKRVEDDVEAVREIASRDALAEVLADMFGVTLSSDDLSALSARLAL